MTDDDKSIISVDEKPNIMDKPAVSARTGRTDFERRTSLEKKTVEKSLLSDRIKKHIEEIEQPKNQANQSQPANMLVNKRVVPSRVKTSLDSKDDSASEKLSKLKISSPKSSRVSSDDSGTLTPSSSDNVSQC